MRILSMIDKPKLWSNEWFECWQVILLLGVNSPFKGMREEVRSRLGIILDRNILVNRLMRNSFRIKIGEREYQETFYGKPVFAIALKREWNWLWNLVHKWDMNFANHYVPKLNLGFDTLTAYPDADPETTTVDGWTYSYSASWATAHSGGGSKLGRASNTSEAGGSGNDGAGTYEIYRLIFLFDTSAIAGGTVSATTLSSYDYGGGYDHSGGQADPNIVSSNPASNTNIVGADFTTLGSTSFASKTFAQFNAVGAYISFSLDANGIANVSTSGVSKFGLRGSGDLSNTAPGSGQYNYVQCYMADQTGTTNDPKLVVTYTLPVTFVPSILNII